MGKEGEVRRILERFPESPGALYSNLVVVGETRRGTGGRKRWGNRKWRMRLGGDFEANALIPKGLEMRDSEGTEEAQ